MCSLKIVFQFHFLEQIYSTFSFFTNMPFLPLWSFISQFGGWNSKNCSERTHCMTMSYKLLPYKPILLQYFWGFRSCRWYLLLLILYTFVACKCGQRVAQTDRIADRIDQKERGTVGKRRKRSKRTADQSGTEVLQCNGLWKFRPGSWEAKNMEEIIWMNKSDWVQT